MSLNNSFNIESVNMQYNKVLTMKNLKIQSVSWKKRNPLIEIMLWIQYMLKMKDKTQF